MGILDDYNKAKRKRLGLTDDENESQNEYKSDSGSTVTSVLSDYNRLKAERLAREEEEEDIAPFTSSITTEKPYTSTKTEENKPWYKSGVFEDGYQFGDVSKHILGLVSGTTEDIAPYVVGTNKVKENSNTTEKPYTSTKSEGKRTWFTSGAFEDGYQFGDITKTLIGTGKDIRENLYAGVTGLVEPIIDAGAYLVGGVGGLFGADKFQSSVQDFIEKNIIDEKQVAKNIDRSTSPSGFISNLILKGTGVDDANDVSVIGDKSDSLLQSAGQLAGTVGLQTVGVPWWVTSGVTSFGSASEEAFNEGASYGEAGISAAISAGAELLTEKLFGGSGLGEKGLINLEPLTKGISSKLVKAIADYGIDVGAEGIEEVVSQFASNLGSSLYKEENIQNILFSEEAIDGYIESFVGGAVLGGGMNIGKVSDSIKTGKDYRTGLTETEQKVFDKVYEDRIAEESENGEVSNKRKKEIREEILNEMEKGYISTDTIDEMFGGDAYKAYKDNIANEEAIRKEYETLYKMKNGEKSDEQIDRQAELKKMLEDIDNGTTSADLRSKLNDEVFGIVKGSRLANSYIDSDNRKKAYTDDVKKYTNKNAQTTIQNAIKSRVVNNSNRAHEMTETLTKLSADKNVVYDFVNDKIIKEQGRQKKVKATRTFTADGTTTEFDLPRIDSSVKPVVKVGNTVVDNYTVDYETGKIVFDSAPQKGKITVDYGAFGRINGWIETLNDGTKKITLNMDSNEVWQFTTGHEITHALEGTKKYKKFREVVYQYAKDKGEYDSLMESVKQRYEEGTDYDTELTADLVGRYLFQDEDFVKHLSANHRNVFQWLWDEVKYLSKVVTAGSKEARQLEKVKHAFENAYRAEGKAKTGTQYSVSRDIDGNVFVDVTEDIFDANNGESVARTIQRVISERFDNLINANGQNIQINKTTNDEFRRSESAGHFLKNPSQTYNDKLKTIANADEILTAAKNWIGEKRNHDRKDDIVEFGRGNIMYRVGENGYVADVLVGIRKNGAAVLYDLVNIYDKKITEAPVTMASNENSQRRQDTSVVDILPQPEAEVNEQFSISDSDGNQLTEQQQEYFKDSKMRDENGNLKVMYHGSQGAGFHTFDSRFSDDDTSFFFVDRNDVAATYSGTAETYEAKTIRSAEDMNNFLAEIGYDQYKAVEKNGKFELLENNEHVAYSDTAQGIYEEFCWYEGVGEGDANYKVYLNLKNPLIVDAQGRNWNNVSKEYSQEIADRYNSLTVEEKAALSDLAEWEDFSTFRDEILSVLEQSSIGPIGSDYQHLASAVEKLGGNNINISNLFSITSDNFSAESIQEFAVKQMNTRDYAQKAKAEDYDGVIFKNIHDNGGYSNGSEGASTVAIAFDSNQIKSVANNVPTSDPDIRYSLSRNNELMQDAENFNNANLGIKLDTARQQRQEIYDFMTRNADRLKLPEDIEGNTAIKNSSYDITEENTTVCIRSMAADALCDAVAEQLGRPLTVQDTLRISQDLMNYTDEPECVYCYVATDRRAYREFLGSYYKQMQSAIEALKSGKNIEEVYQAFLDGRKDTKNMRSRFEMWKQIANGGRMISAKDLASEKMMQIAMKDPELAAQIKDARAYAQSASWAKKRMGYQAYDGHILKWSQRRINDLNKHYGLRFYSFSDFSPAFVLENMQQMTDAAARGLKGLAYTKVLDFAEIFAPTGININISVFGYNQNGMVAQDGMMGADWKGAQDLRNKYENVGVTFVATNDSQIEWALDQDWIDVVIPYHLVRTGQAVAKHFGYTNYTAESGDTKGANWKKGDKKTIYPSEHNNDKQTYLAAIAEANLEPRFARWVNHPNYMKLVNETRRSANDTPPMQANFNVEAAKASLERMMKRGGYFVPIGGDYGNMQDIASDIADDIRAGEQSSISFDDKAPVRYGNFATPMSEVRYEAPTEEVAPVQEVAEEVETPAPVAPVQAELPDEYNSTGTSVGVEETAPMHEAKTEPKGTINGQQMMWGGAGGTNAHVANVMVDEPQVEKKKSRAWSKFRTNFLDKFSVFEDLSLKHKNRELIGKANYMLSAESRAQRLIGNGDEFARVKSLNSIIEEVGNTGKTKQFFEYLYHMHNIDRMTLEERFKNVENKPVFGYSVTAKASQETVEQLEKANPEFKQFAQDVYGFNKHLRNMLVENGVISSETAELWETMYPHFVPIRRLGDTGLNVNVPLDTGKTGVNAPIKRAKGGSRDIMNLFDTMAQRTIQTYKAVAKNNFGVELKNTLRSTITNENASIDEIIDSIDMQDGLLQEGKDGNSPTFTVFENGERVTFEITEDMYDALKPMSEGLAYTNKFANKVSNLHRGLLTEYNPTFLLTNAIKDAQDVLINSQHAAKTYATFPKALQEIVRKGEWYNEYLNNGGEQNTYFDKETNTFKTEERSGLGKVIGIPLDTIGKLNNAVEMLPRLAEYIASREDGRSVEVSMLDAARVTTNFAAGGDITKFLNRNGATFLNASVQGFNQQVRNIREAKANGLKGWVQLAAKAAGAGLSAMLLNHLLWDDDDDYEELSDYVKQNYYVVAKFGDGKFVRIPKGRTLAVIQNAFEQVSNALTGDDEVDLQSFLDLAISNLAPNNPLENNIIAPIMQVANNETWYGEDLVPTRLQDVPAAEQHDESTDSLSRWLGEVLDYSPYKINYLLNQYSGGIGDVFLPMMTPEAESGDDSLLGSFTAPLRDKFTTDSVMNNQNVSDFYDMKDELTANANSINATDEDVLKSKYFNAVNSELGKLYAQKREIQNSNLSDAVKYEQVREIQKQIDSLAKDGIANVETVNIDGNYATVGDRQYRWYEPDEDSNAEPGWQKITDDQLKKQQEVTDGLGITPGEYWSNKAEYDMQYYHPDKYEVLKEQGISISDYKENYEESAFIYTDDYSWAADNPEKYTLSKAVASDLAEYMQYTSELYDIKADKDENGKSISGSRKEKVIDYVNSLDIDYGARLVLFKSEYPSDDSYNYDIINYLEENDAISGEEMRTILIELGFSVYDDGTITWD